MRLWALSSKRTRRRCEVGLDLPQVKLDEKTAKEVFDKLAPSVVKQFGVELPQQITLKRPEIPKAEPKKEAEEKPKTEPKKEPEPEEKPAEKPKTEKPISKLDEITEFLAGGK